MEIKKKNALESIADERTDTKQTKEEKRGINFAFKLFMDLNFTRQNVFTKKVCVALHTNRINLCLS